MNPGFVRAGELLPMPGRRPGKRRLSGSACAWCGRTPLTKGEVDLGPRLLVADGELVRWLPKGCGSCVGKQATQAYRRHVTSCARCLDRAPCPDAGALHDLALKYG